MGLVRERIEREVGSWDGVTVSPHRYGGIEFRRGRRELGHLHGDRLADLPFPVTVRRELVAAYTAEILALRSPEPLSGHVPVADPAEPVEPAARDVK